MRYPVFAKVTTTTAATTTTTTKRSETNAVDMGCWRITAADSQ
jgi:hypothetical protein